MIFRERFLQAAALPVRGGELFLEPVELLSVLSLGHSVSATNGAPRPVPQISV